MKYDVFISYSRKDLKLAEKVCEVFDKYRLHYKFDYFFDREEIHGRQDYLVRISDAISESRSMLFLASKESLKSEFCIKELLFADEEKVHIHQYRLDNTAYPKSVKLLLGNHHYRQASDFSIEDMVREVLSDALKCEIKPLSQLVDTEPPAPRKSIELLSKLRKVYKWLAAAVALLVAFWGVTELYTAMTKKAEQERIELERLVAEKAEQERIELERLVAEKAEQERIERERIAEKAEQERIERERIAKMIEDGKGADGVYEVGYYYNRDGKEGVVFWIDESGKHGKIVSLSEWKVKWSSDIAEQKRFIGANDNRDGAMNMAVVKQIPDWKSKYPAFKWCADLGEGWYLPAIEELKLFTLNKSILDIVNRTLAIKGIQLANIGVSKWYWSSTEQSKFWAWYVGIFRGSTDLDSKDDNLYVRAVSAF